MWSDFRLIMISAMYENGGNFTHRTLDGHPELFVYPFESQLGTRFVNDRFSSLFPVKYRWPQFPLDGTAETDFESIIDEETRVRARTPYVSKFRTAEFEFSDEDRRTAYVRLVKTQTRSRAVNVAAFFKSTFEAWRNRKSSGRESHYVGYSPIIAVDAEDILNDLPSAHVIHVVRNPWSAYADTKKRPVPMALRDYIQVWCIVQQMALAAAKLFPGRMHVVRAEDVMSDPVGALRESCTSIGIAAGDSMKRPTWNGAPLSELTPWGTIRVPTPEANLATANELSGAEKDEIAMRAAPLIAHFAYDSILR